MFPVPEILINAGVTDPRRTSAYDKHDLRAVIAVSREDVPATGPWTNDIERKAESGACKDRL